MSRSHQSQDGAILVSCEYCETWRPVPDQAEGDRLIELHDRTLNAHDPKHPPYREQVK